jgi:hypothetical protein
VRRASLDGGVRGGLPAGTYEIQAWHEKLGTQKSSVTVGADGTQSVDFEFSPPSR